MKKLIGFFQLIRFPNSFLSGLGVIIGLHVSYPNWYLENFNLFFINIEGILLGIFAFLVGFFITGYSMILNDYVDYEADIINNPNKPLPSGLFSKKEALTLSIIFLILGILSAIIVFNYFSFLFVITGILIGYFYNFYLKKKGIYGNLAVAYSTSLPFLYGGSIMFFSNLLPIIILSFLAFMINLAREIIKGIPDIVGDIAKNIKTIANTKGVNFASRIAFYLVVCTVALSFIPFILGLFNIFSFIVIIIADIIFLNYAYKTYINPTKEIAYKSKQYFLLGMFIALIGFLIGVSYE